MNKLIFDLQRFADISNAANDTVITGTANADSITNTGDYVTIDAGDGDDTIYSEGYDVSINGGAGDDNIDNWYSSNNVTINGGNGNDTIYNVGSSSTVKINGDDGDDYIHNDSESVTIDGGVGDDTIYNYDFVENVNISGGDGNDYIENGGSNVTINGGDDDDEIYNSGSDTSIIGGDGNDTIYNWNGSNVTISGGDGNDTIYNWNGSNSTIEGGSGDDTIYNSGANVTINAGIGNDSVYNDIGGDNVTIDGGTGDDTIENLGDSVIIDAGDGDDFINNYSANVTINAGDGKDTIYNGNENVNISGGDGNDYIENDVSNVTINGGEGNDAIYNNSANVTIDGGANLTIDGGAGDDTISLDGDNDNTFIQYNSGDGDDVIIGFGTDDTLVIGDGTGTYSKQTSESGDDVILTVGEGNITLQSAAGLETLNIQGNLIGEDTTSGGDTDISWATIISSEGTTTISTSSTVANGTSGNDTITTAALENDTVSRAVYGNGGNDSIYNAASNVTISGGADADTISLDADSANVLVQYNSGDGDDVIIGFNVSDTIIIDSGTGEYSTVTSEDDVIISTSSGSITLKDAVNLDTLNIDGTLVISQAINNTVDGETITGTALADNISNSGDNVTIDAGDGDNIITNSGSNVTINTGAGDDSVRNTSSASNVTIYTGAGNDIITNNGENVVIETGADDDVINNSATNNVTINGGTGDDTIENIGSNVFYRYTKGDGNDVINGFTENDTLYIESAKHTQTVSGSDLIVNVGDNTITLTDAANLDNANITGSYDEEARAFVKNLQQRTEYGYPVIAGMVFHPTEYDGPETISTDYYASSETLTINSSDNLALKGYHYTPENSNDKWALIIHGYGHNHKHMNGFAIQYLENGYNVLMVDQRAAGESEGEWLTMGTAEGEDVALWTQKIAELNSNAKIVLHGVSMGAATAMLAAANSQITNVVSLVEDCGYTRVTNLVDMLKSGFEDLEDPEFIEVIDDTSESLTGYRLTAAAPIDSIGNVTVPTVFITGTSDSVVTMSNLEELYAASGAEVKEIFTVEGATHGVSALTDSIGYANTVFRFNAEAAGEGWATANTVDAISLRGTSYGDTISNSGSNVSIYAADGDDIIINTDNNKSYIDAGDGDNYISNSLKYSVETINGTETLISEYSDTTIVAGSGNDTISNVGGSYVSIVGGEGDDSIYSKHSYYNTIDAGAGNDWIGISDGHYQNIFLGDGNDTLQGVQEMLGDKGSNWDVGGYANIDGGKGDDVISFGYANDSTITGGEGNDYVIGFGANSFITGGDGDDEIVLVNTKNSSRDSTGATISGGEGNDTITLADANITYKYEGGNDVILGITDSDTLVIDGDTYRTSISGNDLVVSVISSQNTITLKNAADIDVNIDGEWYAGNTDKDGKEIENPVATIVYDEHTYYYESVARASEDADSDSTVTVIANSTETATISTTKNLAIQFAESGLGVYNVLSGNFLSYGTINDANFSMASGRILSNNGVNNLQIANGSTATLDNYEITGTSNGYTFSLQNNPFTFNGVSYYGEGTATFDTSAKVTLTSGAIVNDSSLATSDAGIVLAAGEYTLNGNTFTTTATHTVYLDSDGAHFNVSSDVVTYNSFTFNGDGSASIKGDLPTLTAGVSISRPERAMVVLTEKGQNTIDGRGFQMIKDLSDGITVGAVDNGIGAAHIIPYESFPEDAGKLFAEEALIYGDDSYTVRLNEDGIKSIYGISAGSTVRGKAYFEGEVDPEGSVLQMAVDGSGSYTFGDKTYTINGDIDSVNVVGVTSRFYNDDSGLLRNVYYLNGTLSGEFSSAVTINQSSMPLQIAGDTNVDIYATDSAKASDDANKSSISSAGNVSVISGVGNGATIFSAGGATKVSTNEEGLFYFRDNRNDPEGVTLQNFTVSGDDSVDFILRNYIDGNGNPTMQVEGINNFENGTLIFDEGTKYTGINVGDTIKSSDEFEMEFVGNITFTIADSKVVSIDGINNKINNIKGDVNVHASSDITVNNVYVNVKGDEDFDVLVTDGSTTALTNISAGASVSVDSISATTDNNGDFTFATDTYKIEDTNNSVTFVTGKKGAVTNITDFSGTMQTSAQNVTVNGAAFTTSNTDASIISAGTGISRIEGLVSGDSVGGALDTTTILMATTSDTLKSILTVNDISYTLAGNAENVSITGNVIDGLETGGALEISHAGLYVVNNTALTVNVGDVIIGTAENSAYIYDANNVPLDIETMTDDEIASQAGISTNYSTVETNTMQANSLVEQGGSALDGTMALALDNSNSNIEQTADFSENTGRKKVTLEGGEQGVKFNDEGGNVAVISSDSTGEKNVSLGGGGDLAIIEGTEAPVNITAGNGNDSIVTAGQNVSVNLNGGATKIIPNAGSVSLENYNPATGAGIQANDYADLSRAIINGNIQFGNGVVSLGSAVVSFASEDDSSYNVNLFNNKGRKQKVGFTNSSGGELDASGERENMLLIGNKDGNKDGSTFASGNGNDVAFGGAGDTFDLGAGNNSIYLDENRNNPGSATINQTATSGSTEVNGFKFGFGDSSDRININLSANVSYKNGQLTFNIGGAMLIVNGSSSADLAESADLIEDENFINGTTLDDITPITYEQSEYQNIYGTNKDSLNGGVEITFAQG